MRTLGAFLKWLILLPILAVVLLLAVANDQMVTVHLNPFDTGDPVLKADMALYQLAFIVLVVGALLGALSASRGRLRHRTRRQDEQAAQRVAHPEPAARRAEPQRPAANVAAYLPRPERG